MGGKLKIVIVRNWPHSFHWSLSVSTENNRKMFSGCTERSVHLWLFAMWLHCWLYNGFLWRFELFVWAIETKASLYLTVYIRYIHLVRVLWRLFYDTFVHRASAKIDFCNDYCTVFLQTTFFKILKFFVAVFPFLCLVTLDIFIFGFCRISGFNFFRYFFDKL